MRSLYPISLNKSLADLAVACFDTGASSVQQDFMDLTRARPDDSPNSLSHESRGCIPGTNTPVFSLSNEHSPALPIVIAVPHAGRDYPGDLLDNMRDPDFSRVRLEDRYVDRLAEQIAELTGAPMLVSNAPRAMLDLNRAPDDVDWSMVVGGQGDRKRHSAANRRARSGLGLIPRRLPTLGEIWKRPITRAELDLRLAAIHTPYHKVLGQTLEKVRDRWGTALLIDLHSMPPLKARHPGERPAQFVIGDRFGSSCDAMLLANAFRYFARHDRLAAHNRPYSGGYVLDRHAQPARGVHAVQLEVCRNTYLDRHSAEPSFDLPAVAELLSGLVSELARETAAIGRDRHPAIAAE